MAIILLIIIIIANSVFQGTVLPYLNFLGHLPNTSIALVISIGLLRGKYYGGFFGLALGLVQDILFARAIGVNAFIYFMLGYLVGSIKNVLNDENIFIPGVFSALATIFYHLVYFIFMYFLARNISISTGLNNMFSIEIIYNAILGMLAYRILSNIFVEPSLRFGRK